MAKRVQRRRGSTSEHSSFTGAVGEITVDLTKDTVAVHDGSQAGGFPLAREDMNNVTNRVGITQLNCADGSNGQVLSTNGSGTLSFSTVDATTANVGGDLSGTVGNAQIVANAVTATELATNAVTTVNITDANVTAAKMATNSVTTIKITDANVTTPKIANSAITSAKIQDGTIVAGDLADDAVTSAKILDGNVATINLADAAVTTVKIADANVTTNKLAADCVTPAKIADAAIETEHYSVGNFPAAAMDTSPSHTLPGWSGENLTNLPYDIAFTAGFDKDMATEDIAVAIYGEMVMPRAGTFVGDVGWMDVSGNGTTTFDILKNGTTIYSTKPRFQQTNGMTSGTLSTTTFAVRDRITFKCTSFGVDPGEGVRFTLKCKV